MELVLHGVVKSFPPYFLQVEAAVLDTSEEKTDGTKEKSDKA